MSIRTTRPTGTSASGAGCDDFDDAPTTSDGKPVAEVSDQITAPHDLRKSAEFRIGLEIGAAQGRHAGEADAVTEMRIIREDVIDTVRGLWVIFDIKEPSWETAEAWIRRRLTPI